MAWTGGNLHLIKVISRIFYYSDLNVNNSEVRAVDRLVEGLLIKKWENSESTKYIRDVKQNLVDSQRCDSKLLLKEYQEILLSGEKQYQDTDEQKELLLLGLISRQDDNRLQLANLIYQQIFNPDLIDRELRKIQPKNTSKDDSDTAEEPLATNLNYVEIKMDSKAEDNPSDNSKSKFNIYKPIAILGSLITLGIIALLVPWSLKDNDNALSQSDNESLSWS